MGIGSWEFRIGNWEEPFRVSCSAFKLYVKKQSGVAEFRYDSLAIAIPEMSE